MPIGNVAKRRGKAKIKISSKREAAMQRIMDSYSEDLDVKISVIQDLIPLGLKAVADELQNEVKRLAGDRHSRVGNNARWGHQNGSVYLRDQKLPVTVPRVRNVDLNTEVPLEAYRRLQTPRNNDADVMRKLLHGLSTHKYHESSTLAAEVFGISASNLSKRFKRCSADKLKELQERSLKQYDIVAVFIDAKRYADDGLIVSLGVTIDGRKVTLGVEQSHNENSRAIEQWFDKLITRGLRFEDGILFIIDGSKGIRKAIERKFSIYALIQRCRWHKRENVVAYLDDSQQTLFRRLQTAYEKTTYKEAGAALDVLHRELETVNMSAANSLAEGLEETLTIHHLGLSPELAKSLSNTNCMEPVMSQMGQYTDKVDRWRNSSQILRWTATSLMDVEPRLNKIRGHRYLSLLRSKLQGIIRQRLQKESIAKEPETAEVSMVGVD
jgi:transposase-like protein